MDNMMKKLIIITLAGLAIISCNKQEDLKPKDEFFGEYKISSALIYPKYKATNNAFENGVFQPCEKDHIISFYSDGTYIKTLKNICQNNKGGVERGNYTRDGVYIFLSVNSVKNLTARYDYKEPFLRLELDARGENGEEFIIKILYQKNN